MTQCKRCPDCGRDLPLAAFPRNRKRPDGRGLYCSTCFAERYRAYRVRKAAQQGKTIQHRRDLEEGIKWCPDCQQTRPLEDFPRNRSMSDGRGGYCKPCHNKRGRETKLRLYGGTREYHLRHRYGIGQAEVDAMIGAQGGTCAVCAGKPEHVDHDHKTGQVRGVLCFLCNQALGNVRDDPAVLTGLIRYLGGSKETLDTSPYVMVVHMVRANIEVDLDRLHLRSA